MKVGLIEGVETENALTEGKDVRLYVMDGMRKSWTGYTV